MAEQDVQQVVASSVLQLSDERYSAAQSLSFDILDGAVQADGKLVLLYSQSKAEHEPLNYGLAVLDAVKDAGRSLWHRSRRSAIRALPILDLTLCLA